MAKYLETIYVSGWQCSSTASTSNEPGPDLADYPMDTVPNKVHPSISPILSKPRHMLTYLRSNTCSWPNFFMIANNAPHAAT